MQHPDAALGQCRVEVHAAARVGADEQRRAGASDGAFHRRHLALADRPRQLGFQRRVGTARAAAQTLVVELDHRGYPADDGSTRPVHDLAPLPAPPDYAVPLRAGYRLLGITAAQGVIGYVQVATHLPIALVNLHMLGAALLVMVLTLFVGTLRTRRPGVVAALVSGVVATPDTAAA